MIRSDYIHREPAQLGESSRSHTISSKAKYTGTNFHMGVQQYLSKHVDIERTFKEKHLSKFN